MMNIINDAFTEYNRLCELIGRPPYGDCELVALMLHKKVGGNIIKGYVTVEDGDKLEHFWLEIDDQICDPLSKDWKRLAVAWEKVAIVDPNSIIEDLKGFLKDFPTPSKYSLFPLRWKVFI
jgi:hypothetical protein